MSPILSKIIGINVEGNIKHDNANLNEKQIVISEIKKVNKFSGGNKKYFSKEKSNEWKNSIKINNCEVIEYANLISIRNILPLNIKQSLKNALDIVEKKYNQRKEYLKIIEERKDTKIYPLKGKGNISSGIIEERKEIPIILKKDFSFHKNYSKDFSKRHLDINESSPINTKIIGYELKWKDENNPGEYFIPKNPLLKTDIICNIVSKNWYPIDITLSLYYIQEPD